MVDIPTGYFIALTGASAIFGLFSGIFIIKLFGRKSKESPSHENVPSPQYERQEIYSLVLDLGRVSTQATDLYHQDSPVSRAFSITWARIADRGPPDNRRPGRLSSLKSDLEFYLERGKLPRSMEEEGRIISETKYDIEKGLKELTPYATKGGMITEEQKIIIDSFSDEAMLVLDRAERVLRQKKS